MEDYKNMSADKKIEFWHEHIKKWKESGLSQATYCRQNGISRDAFNWRKRRLEKSSNSRLTKVPMQTVSEIIHDDSALELSINGKLKVRVDRNFNPELLQRLLKTLGAWDDSQLI